MFIANKNIYPNSPVLITSAYASILSTKILLKIHFLCIFLNISVVEINVRT
jgi:hypothetical protein